LTDIYKLPESLYIFFQEFDPSHLDLIRDTELIIERTLRFGNRVELRWLFAHYGRQRIASWISDMGRYRLPKRHLSFWSLLLDIEIPPQRERKAIWPH